MSRRSKVSLAIGVIVFLATMGIYAVIHPMIFPSAIVGLCFLLYAEVVFFGGFVLIDFWSRKSSKLMLWPGIGVPLSIYAVIVFISSFVFINAHTTNLQGFWILQIVLFVIAAAICLIVGSFSIGAKEKEEKVLNAERTVQYTIDQLLLIKEQTDKKADIDKLIDGLRFSDVSVAVDADVEICDAIAALQSIVQSTETDGDEFSRAVQSIEFLIKKRKLQANASKQGGI